jgi:hypothetical protein
MRLYEKIEVADLKKDLIHYSWQTTLVPSTLYVLIIICIRSNGQQREDRSDE